jgi:hypothetical protein
MVKTSPIRMALTDEEKAELERLSRALTAPHRVVVRAKIILKLAAGESLSAVSRTVGRRRRHVQKWAKRFERKRLKGLEDRARSGRPARFSPRGRRAPGEAGVRAA